MALRDVRVGIASNGNIGIGTNPSVAKLEVLHPTATSATVLNDPIPILSLKRIGSNSQSYDACATFKLCRYENVAYNSRTRLDIVLYHGENTEAPAAMSIASNGNVVIGGNVNVGSLTNPSDSRIKKDIEDINDDTALNRVLLIQPKIYNYIDEERNKGFGKVYGFIAQQIREVIPEAVPIINTISPIPNIYKSCLIINKREVYHTIPLDTPIDTSVKIDNDSYKIKEIYEDYFVIDKDIETDEAFVYGYNVDDFHTLNKDYIFTLNVCATQELHRRIEAQSLLIKSQDDRITGLETKMERMLSGTT